eukprot:TRINITY_DN34542_c0_g1_i1.p2 TRINITY_DN34542_c0_g1~~TRINITY_DN34542_c0_g1_i1.p2  ORF type:complete len:313 (+),score=17.67 TRINITY_DN34542_c0_g1_i1:183-1121(+)
MNGTFSHSKMTDQQFTFGEHIGKKYSLVALTDQSYCVWALAQSKPSLELQKFVAYVQNIQVLDKLIVQFGQYQSKSFLWAYQNDPNYCSWVLQQDPMIPEMKLFQYYLKQKYKQLEEIGQQQEEIGKFIPDGYCIRFMADGGCSLSNCNSIHDFPKQWSKQYCQQWRKWYKSMPTLLPGDIPSQAKNKQSRRAESSSIGTPKTSSSVIVSKAVRGSGSSRVAPKKTAGKSTVKDRIMNKINGEKTKPKKIRKIRKKQKPKSTKTGVSTKRKSDSPATQSTSQSITIKQEYSQITVKKEYSVGRPTIKTEPSW